MMNFIATILCSISLGMNLSHGNFLLASITGIFIILNGYVVLNSIKGK